MRNYIILNNQRSDEISGLIIQELAPISKPLQRTQVETIDGRDGDIITPLGYAAYNKKIKIGLYGTFDINEIIAYFATEGQVVFSNEPDKYYNYQIVDQIDYERLVRYKVATVTMHVQPFKYSATEGTITVDASDTVSGEGSEIALNNTAEAPFNTLRHKGNATQTTYSGKNLFDYASASDAANTTVTQYRVFAISGLEPNARYTISGQTVPQITDGNKFIYFWSASTYSGAERKASLKSASTFSFDANADGVIYLAIYPTDTATWESVMPYLENAQLELGSTATAYEPYVGGTASPNPDYPQDIHVVTGEQTVKITGKNLAYDGWAQDFVTRINNAEWANIGQYEGRQSLMFLPRAGYGDYDNKYLFKTNFAENTQYTFSFDEYTTDQFTSLAVVYTDGTTEVLYYGSTEYNKWIHVVKTTAQNKTVKYLRVNWQGGAKYIDLSSFMCEKSATATDYEPYKEQSYVIPFGDTYLAAIGDYADEPVKVGDTWYIRRAIGKVVLDGTESGWTWADTARYAITTPNIGAREAISDHFTYVNYTGHATTESPSFDISSSLASIGFHNKDITSLNNFKTWLASNPTTVYYALATPTDEAITDQDLIDALDEFYGQAHSYKGRTHLTATPQGDNAPAVLAVEVGEDNESTVTNAGNTTSRPILTIYGQGDIGVYINDVEVLDIELGDEGYITLDSVEMEAYKDNTANLKNRLVTGDYSKLALNAGANKIRFTGTVTKYEISKYSRWL